MYNDGVRCFVEVGPHSVLTKSCKAMSCRQKRLYSRKYIKKGENEIEHFGMLWDCSL